MVIAVTGGSGFIGAALVQALLERGHAVRILSRQQPSPASTVNAAVQYYRGDLLDPDCNLGDFVSGADVLYHCAGELHDPNRMHALHVEGTSRLAAAAAGRIAHWVQLSSVGAYGPQRDGIVTERTPEAPIGPYEVSKTESDQAIASVARNGAFACTIVRPSNVIGPSMPNRSVFQLINAISRGRFVFIGKPGAMASYVHVDNVVHALLLAGDARPKTPTIYNVSDHCSFEQFVEYVCQALLCPKPRLRIPVSVATTAAWMFRMIPGFPLTPSRVMALSTRATYAMDKMRAELNYSPVVSIHDAITQMAIAWKSGCQR